MNLGCIRARGLVLQQGGVAQANVFTKITLALFGQYDWRGIPCMPPEIFLAPQWFYFNVICCVVLVACSYYSALNHLCPSSSLFSFSRAGNLQNSF